jgi:DNA relaxase NicK
VSNDGYCSVELPGELVQSIPLERLRSTLVELRCRWQPSRLDLAWDHSHYKPADVYAAVEAEQMRSLAKRETLRELREPFKPGGAGHTVYLGSRQSERMLRVYLRDGRTRTELECKGDRARAVLLDLLQVPGEEWAARALSHLRDYCDFAAEWWEAFCCGVERAFMKLTKWAEVSIKRSHAWMKKQGASTLAMIEDAMGFSEILRLLNEGREKYGGRHRAILAQCGVTA